MLPRLRFLLAYFFFWVLFFEAARLLFVLYHFSKTAELPFRDLALSFLYGLRMDVSMASYVLAPVCLFLIAGVFVAFFRKSHIYLVYSYVILLLVLLVTLADLEIYKAWGFRMDATPLKYLASPQEVWASISHLPLLLIALVFAAVYVSLCLLTRRLLRKRMAWLSAGGNRLAVAGVLLLVTAFLIVPIRGGFQLTPMNQSMVYFSKKDFANIAAVNASWNFLNGLAEGASTDNPYQYLDKARVGKITDSLYQGLHHTKPVLKTRTPNVIVIIWESFTEKATHQSIGGLPITPGFNELKKEGIYFSNAYASGDRTDKGVAAVLSGYPALNKVSIIRFPGKSARLQTLSGFFKEKGYSTSFYYGGETEFANIKSYLLQSRYDRLVDKNHFNSKDLNSKWGAHDGVVAKKFLEDIGREPAPFFATWLTLSSHEPFETPLPPVFEGRDVTTQFANSLHYTDQVVYQFVRQCQQQPWWDNTLIVIVSDHGHALLEPSDWLSNFRISMLWLGGALDTPPIIIERPVSQLDLATTLSAQLGGKPGTFPFSKNLFDTTALSWAYFSFNNGFGLVQPGREFVFDNIGRQLISQKGPVTAADIEAGKAMQQFTFQDYIEK